MIRCCSAYAASRSTEEKKKKRAANAVERARRRLPWMQRDQHRGTWESLNVKLGWNQAGTQNTTPNTPPPFPCISVSQEQGFGEAGCTPSKLKTEKTLTDSNVRYRHGRRLPRLHDLSNKVTPPSKRPPSSGAFIPPPLFKTKNH